MSRLYLSNPCALFPFCTRCCGRSRRPAFPAPSVQGGTTRLQNSDEMSRENGDACPRCRPGERRDPYAAAETVETRWWTALLRQRRPVVMGPGVRRDDTECVA